MTKIKARQISPIIPIEDWLQDEFFLGPEVPYIRPYVKDFIKAYAEGNRRKFICTGAARTGKSYGVRILIQRILYEMSCWENFPCLFGLSPSTTPKIYWLSYTMSKAESTGLKQLIKMIDKVPYWQLPHLKRKPLESELKFPFCEVLSGSNISHIIGEDTLGCVLDEANVRKVASGTEVEEAQRMFTEMRQRSVMTFSRNGIWGGFSGIISSSTTSSSFVYQELQKAKEKNDTVIMEASVYEANPEQFSKETFDVYLGDSDIPPFIIDKADAAIIGQINTTYGLTLNDFLKEHEDNIEKVPVSIREFYEEDLIFSLANMSGKVQAGGSKWLKPKLVSTLWNEERKPFKDDLINCGIYDEVDWEDILKESEVMASYHGENVYIHVDFGLKHDHTGFSALFYDKENHKVASLLTMEMKVDEEKGSDNQTDQTKIWELILLLKAWGANIKLVTGDIWAKSYLIPQAKLQDTFTGEYYSVDTDDMAAYLTMQKYMKVGLYSVPYYKRLEEELLDLVRDGSNGKIDHPANPNSSKPMHFKDLVDAFAGASFHIYTRENVSYEDLIMQSGREKVRERVPDDGFYSSISYEQEEDDIDEFAEFANGLMGDDIGYTVWEGE